MQMQKISLLTPRSAIGVQVRRLAQVQAGAAPFLSAYLDLRKGVAPAERWLEGQASAHLARLRGRQRHAFDSAFGLLKGVLQGALDPAAQGLVVFARGLRSGRSLTVLQVDVPLADRLVFYRVPDLTGLLGIDQRAQHQVLLLARQGALQAFDLDLGPDANPDTDSHPEQHLDSQIDSGTVLDAGCARPRAWAAFSDAASDYDQDGASSLRDLPGSRLHHLLVPRYRGSVVVAGDAYRLEAVVDGLSERVAARLSGVIDVPDDLSQHEALQFVVERLKADQRANRQHVVQQLLRAFHQGGPAVAGSLAVLDALRAGRVEKLLIAERCEGKGAKESMSGGACGHCGEIEPTAERPLGCCAQCGEQGVIEWRAETELVRLASQQGLPVIPVDADELRDLGGVACLLRQVTESQVRSPPQSVTRPGHRIDLAA